MLIAYPALFYYDPTEKVKFFVHFPDFDGSGTQGTDVTDALYMSSDWLGIHAAAILEDGKDLPESSAINDLSLVDNDPFKNDPDIDLNYDATKSFISMVSVDLSQYFDDSKPIKKTLTIPKWADKLGKKHKVNFSQLLTDAILQSANK